MAFLLLLQNFRLNFFLPLISLNLSLCEIMSTMCVHLSSASSGGLSFTKIIGFIKRWLGSKEMLLFLLNFEGTLVRSLWIDTSGDCGRGLLRPLDCPSLFFSAVLASSLSFTAAAWIAASRSMSWNRRRSDWWVLLYYLLEFYYYWILLFNGNKMNNAGTHGGTHVLYSFRSRAA